MPNTKTFKFSFSLSSFRLCRPRKTSSFPKTPTPTPTPKVISMISYPPPPPPPPTPSTPNQPSSYFNPHFSQLHDSCSHDIAMEKSTPKKQRGGNRKKKKKNVNINKAIDYSSTETEAGMKDARTKGSSKNSRKKIKIQKQRRRNDMSYAMVVKTSSQDPHLDFKNSMMEMILDKQMFDAKELEQLLHCFLSLNSKHHVPAILSAFTEVWETLFSKIPPQINAP